MPTLKINDMEIEVAPGTSVLQACEQLGIEVPRFCYHDRLSVPANCRMCLVEQKGAPKPIASCAVQAADGMEIQTHSEMVKKARHGVMEFLLINHPLDCPICDQGGECDLQDQAMAYGFDRGRYNEKKRAVPEKFMGPLIKTFMNRCIHCTRCVRFSEEIAGVEQLGMLGRGENSEIGTYVEAAVASELSGNLVDVCPVGALTSKPYQFEARPWELKKTQSIDVMDAVGSNIRIDARGPEVLRVLPRLHEDINEEWIADKTRQAHDGLKRQRLDRPYIRERGKLRPASWEDALAAAAKRLKKSDPARIAAFTGDLVDVEAVYALKSLMNALGVDQLECRQDGARFDTKHMAGWRLNSTIAGLEQADAVLLVGTNPRWEAPLVNARLRKRSLEGGLKVGLVGQPVDLTYGYKHLGAGGETLSQLADGSHEFIDVLKAAERSTLIAGMAAFTRPDGMAVHAALREIAEATGMVSKDWNGFNLLQTAAGRVGALTLGFVPSSATVARDDLLAKCQSGEIDTVFLLGADEIEADRFGDAFVIYQGHHGDRGAARADIIFPGAAYTEKTATYLNVEGRPQIARRAVYPPGDAREDWAILRALSDHAKATLPFNSLAELRAKLREDYPVFAGIDAVPAAKWLKFGKAGKLDDTGFGLAIENYYMTDPISRASTVMAQCTEAFVTGPARAGRTGTDG